MDIEKSIAQLRKFDEAYFAGNPLIEDAQYDQLKETVRLQGSDHPYFDEVGSPVRGGKIALPYKMGSLNQIYEEDYTKWIEKYSLENKSIVVTEKLDGMSVLLVYERKGQNLSLQTAYSRGNGIEGADITRHIRQLPSTPVTIQTEDINRIVIRAEVIINEETFQRKYSKESKNSRNMVAGCMNRKTTDAGTLKDIALITYEIVDIDSTANDSNTKNENLQLLKSLGFLVVNSQTFLSDSLNDAKLKELYSTMQNDGSYMLDGIVLTVDHYNDIEQISKSSSINPEHSVKYKNISEEYIVETTVKDVHWKISKSGFFKPRVEIAPVELFGTTVTFATGFNGKFISDNGIGQGAIIKITKAGSVIPYIVEVVSKVDPTLPEGDWEWDSLGVEIRSVETTPEVIFMQVVHFFKTLAVEQLQETSLRKILKYLEDQKIKIDTFEDIVSEVIYLLDRDMQNALGVNGVKAYDSLHKKLSSMKPETLLGATPYFGQGFGTRKAKKIMDQMSLEDFLKSNELDIMSIEGFDKTVERVLDGIDPFESFYDKISDYVTFTEVDKNENGSLANHVVVMTGFRDKELQDKIELAGGKVASGVSKKTTIVIAADPASNSGKVKKAKELQIPVLSLTDFEYTYIL